MIAAVALDKASGSYRIAARHLEEIAQIYEDKLDEQQKAYDYYDEASNLYHADNSPTFVSSAIDSFVCRHQILKPVFAVGWPTDAH